MRSCAEGDRLESPTCHEKGLLNRGRFGNINTNKKKLPESLHFNLNFLQFSYMFYGKMQSFYRRNTTHNQSSSQTSKSKEQLKRVKHIVRNDIGEECPIRRRSFSISKNGEPEEEYNRTEIPVIKIGLYEPENTKKNNILKEKEKALWYNTSPDLDDNRERLGPNKNNIIEETLEVERRKSGDWGH